MKKLISLFKKGLLLCGCGAVGWFFSKGAMINGKDIPEDYFSGGIPTVITLLDAEWFVGFVAFVTLAIVLYLIHLAWEFHELAVHHAQKHMVAHVTLVSALSLAGLFVSKTWWILAIIIAFTNWKALGDTAVVFVKRLKES